VKILYNETDGSSYRTFDYKKIPYSRCTLGRNIFYENKVEISQFNIYDYFCPDWNNLTIQGNWNSPQHTRIEIVFQRCLEKNEIQQGEPKALNNNNNTK